MSISPEICIVCGKGSRFGTGHVNRMNILQNLLHKESISSRLLFIEDIGEKNITEILKAGFCPTVWVLDARDVNPEGFAGNADVIALDNRCANRNVLESSDRIIFFDTIPHPEADLRKVLINTLIDPELIRLKLKNQFAAGMSMSSNTALVYSGDMPDTNWLDGMLYSLCETGVLSGVIRVGIARLADEFKPAIIRMERLENSIFYEHLVNSDFVFSYFGMFYLESLFMEKMTFLYRRGPKNSEHDVLSRYFTDNTGLIYITNSNDLKKIHSGIRKKITSSGIPGGEGYSNLLGIILEKLRKLV